MGVIIVATLAVVAWMLLPAFFSGKKVAAIELQSGRIYSSEQPVVLKGTTSQNAKLIIFFQNNVAFTNANDQGNWSANLGSLPGGIYYVQVLSQDSPKKESVLATDFSVTGSHFLSDAISRFFAADLSLSVSPPPLRFFTIPAAAPVLQGTWKLVQ